MLIAPARTPVTDFESALALIGTFVEICENWDHCFPADRAFNQIRYPNLPRLVCLPSDSMLLPVIATARKE